MSEQNSKSYEKNAIRTAEAFEEIIANGDLNGVRAFLSDTTDSERESFSPIAIRWYKKASKGEFKESIPGRFSWEWAFGQLAIEASALAVVATAKAEQLAKIDWQQLPDSKEDLDWLATLKPRALENFGDVLMENRIARFYLVRDLLTRKLCRKPENDQYIVGLIMAGRGFYTKASGNISLHDWLLANPDVLEEDIWRIFEIEGDQENSLAAVDKYSTIKPWSSALVALTKSGHLSKQRLLEASLSALNRGFNQFKSGWFSRFHEELEPSQEEREVLTEGYARLLGSSTPPTVAFAVKALEQIDNKRPLPEDLLLKHLTPALVSSSKSTTAAAIRLIERALKRNNNFATSACLMIVSSLQHDSPDIQAKVMTLLEKWGDQNDSALKTAISSYIETAAPSVRARMQTWTNQTPQKSDRPSLFAKYVMEAASKPGWPLVCMPAVEPLESIQSILSQAGYCLEHADDVDEIERVLDSIARTPILPSESFKALSAPLKQRATKLLAASRWLAPHFGNGQSLQLLFADFIQNWLALCQNLKSEGPRTTTLHPGLRLMAMRMSHIHKRLKNGIFLPLLSTPTHFGGWINPAQFLEREKLWNETKSTPDQFDLLLAVLRIPVGETEVLSKSRLLKRKEITGVLELLTGEDSSSSDPNAALTRLTTTLLEPLNKETGLELLSGALADRCDDHALLEWIAIACPRLRECFFAAAIKRAAAAVTYWSAEDRVIKVYLKVLTASGAPLEEKALTLLSIGLILSDPECCGMARDAVIIAIEERRLDLPKFAFEVSAYLHSQRSMPKRLAKSLGEIARVSDVHSDAVARIIELSLRGDFTKAARELSSLLELLQELLISQERKLDDENARAYLQSITRGGKTAQLAKKLLVGDNRLISWNQPNPG